MSATEPGLSTVALTKSYGGVTAVDGATVEFRDGKINALIGQPLMKDSPNENGPF